MFRKILVANRGEIACRILRTAKRMGIRTVAVYSEADRDALHVEMADEAVPIGPAPAAQSYLDIEKIRHAIHVSGAEAVHPGYGFLSENARFARALAEDGIAFIGPNVTAIEVMGDKIASKKAALAAKVNVIPGHVGEIADVAEARKIAETIGYPIMIKASAGGGGKGMRIAHTPQELEEGFQAARSEAKSSFGDDRVFLEKFIEQPRHIEIQVLADKHGNRIHLGERECSIQRRNQKVVEEAPSVFLDETTRQAMGAQAVALAAAVDYESAGTVEFVVDPDRNFYFLEMNTRLQVEHPVTELITGLDLVEQMIRIAAGEELALRQDDVTFTGWAVECRIYAEDPYRNFLPSTGRLVRYRPPAEKSEGGITIRNDTGVYEGGEIPVHYDPMIAKLIVHGPDRDAAIHHMTLALDEFYIDGIGHNIPFLAAIMQNPRWQKGQLSTNFIAEEYPDGFVPRTPSPEELDALAVVAAAIDHLGNQRRRRISTQMPGKPVAFSNRRVVDLEGDQVHLTIEGELGAPCRVTLLDDEGKPRGEVTVISDWWPGEPIWRGTLNGEPLSVQVRPILNGHDLSFRGIHRAVRVYTKREAELAALMPERAAKDTASLLLSPMPGLIVSLQVAEGDKVEQGQPLCVVEAMKMENILRAARAAKVKKIHVAPGDSVALDAVIMEFEPEARAS